MKQKNNNYLQPLSKPAHRQARTSHPIPIASILAPMKSFRAGKGHNFVGKSIRSIELTNANGEKMKILECQEIGSAQNGNALRMTSGNTSTGRPGRRNIRWKSARKYR